MVFNPEEHHRRSIRLQGYDYSQGGMYFVTICCNNQTCWFGEIIDDEMVLNEYGNIAYNEWVKLSERFCNFESNIFVIMPNHIHGIIELTNNNNTVGATMWAGASPAPTISPTIGDIIGAYKSLVAMNCLKIYKSKNQKMGKLWQRNYYEHIIRNDESYCKIAEYIENNPGRWNEDKFYYGNDYDI